MKALGVHVYGGGFLYGLTNMAQVVGSVETFELPAPLRHAIMPNVPDLTFSSPFPYADVIVSNPPCSRFSGMSCNRYSQDQKRSVQHFPEMMEVLDVVKTVRPRLFCWETGPLLYSQPAMIISVHDYLKTMFPHVTTLMVSYNLLSSGLPQKRRRNHIFHFLEPMQVLGLPVLTPNFAGRIQDLESELNYLTPEPYTYHLKPDESTMDHYYRMLEANSFNALKPVMFMEDTPVFLTVLSGRCFGWAERERWFAREEYAALMGYPLRSGENIDRDYITMLSKSVSPAASEQLFTQMIAPAMASGKLDGPKKPTQIADKVYQYYEKVDTPKAMAVRDRMS